MLRLWFWPVRRRPKTRRPDRHCTKKDKPIDANSPSLPLPAIKYYDQIIQQTNSKKETSTDLGADSSVAGKPQSLFTAGKLAIMLEIFVRFYFRKLGSIL